MDKERWLEIARKARYMKGKRLTKKELNEIYDGAMALEKLGFYDKEQWSTATRKEVRYERKK